MLSLTFLGTSAGRPTKDRACSSVAAKYRNELLLFDCGEGTQRQLLQAGLSLMKINHIFITHWHADHYAGLVPLLQTLSLMGRTQELHVYGPENTRKYVNALLKVGYAHYKFKVSVKDIAGKAVLKTPEYTVTATAVNHGIPAIAYRFQEADEPGRVNLKNAKKHGVSKNQLGQLQKGKRVRVEGKTINPSMVLASSKPGKSFVYTGDTGYATSLVKLSSNADLLIHESTYSKELDAKAAAVGHSIPTDAAQIAMQAGVKQLILTHISPRYGSTTALLNEAKAIFKNTRVAHDFLKVSL